LKNCCIFTSKLSLTVVQWLDKNNEKFWNHILSRKYVSKSTPVCTCIRPIQANGGCLGEPWRHYLLGGSMLGVVPIFDQNFKPFKFKKKGLFFKENNLINEYSFEVGWYNIFPTNILYFLFFWYNNKNNKSIKRF